MVWESCGAGEWQCREIEMLGSCGLGQSWCGGFKVVTNPEFIAYLAFFTFLAFSTEFQSRKNSLT